MSAPTTALTVAERSKGFAMFLNPETLEQVREVAMMLSKSDMVPKIYKDKPGDIIIAGAMGDRLGLDLFASLAGIAPINGRPCIWGDLMLAVCMRHADWGDFTEVMTGKPGADDFTATTTVMRKGRQPYAMSFACWEAKHAGLWEKQGPWKQTPARMLQMRARAFALRGAFPDALAGFHAREEMEGAIDVQGEVIDSQPAGPAEPVKVNRRIAKAAKTQESDQQGAQEPASATNGDEPGKDAPGEAPGPGTPPAADAQKVSREEKAPAKSDEPSAPTETECREYTLSLTGEPQPIKDAMAKVRADLGVDRTNWKAKNADPAFRIAYMRDLKAAVAKVRAEAQEGGGA